MTPEGTTQIGPPRGVSPNYKLECSAGFVAFQILDPKTERIGLPLYVLQYLTGWQRRDLRVLIADELRKHGLSGAWSRHVDPEGFDLWLQPAHGARAGILVGEGI